MNEIKRYNMTQVEYYPEKQAKKKLPSKVAEMLMQENAKADYRKGGFGCKCEKCGEAYGQSYLTYCYLGSFKEGYCCKECVKKFHLQKA